MHITIAEHSSQQKTPRYDAACRAAGRQFSERLLITRTLARLAPKAAVTNMELAVLLGCSAGQASKLVDRHPTLLRRRQSGRYVAITRA